MEKSEEDESEASYDEEDNSGSDDSDVEEDMGKVSVSDESSESVKKGNVYKAPKMNAVAYEDPRDKKNR